MSRRHVFPSKVIRSQAAALRRAASGPVAPSAVTASPPPPAALGPEVLVFHAGTVPDPPLAPATEGTLRTAGGRVLAVPALGATVPEAGRRSAAACERITFDGKTWRRDIAWREMRRAGAA